MLLCFTQNCKRISSFKTHAKQGNTVNLTVDSRSGNKVVYSCKKDIHETAGWLVNPLNILHSKLKPTIKTWSCFLSFALFLSVCLRWKKLQDPMVGNLSCSPVRHLGGHPVFYSHRITAWVGLEGSLKPTLSWAGTPPTEWSCPKPHTARPWAPPGRGKLRMFFLIAWYIYAIYWPYCIN